METTLSTQHMSRRQLLQTGGALGVAFVIGPSFVANAAADWALELKALKPETMATLIQLARDIYPHDRIPDKNYAIAVREHDEKASSDSGHADLVERGVGTLDTIARGRGFEGYLGAGWEDDRVDILKQIEDSPFFQTVRGGLVVGLYNQHEIWPTFGYEGESFSKGGYINRGFDDIDWL